MKYAVAEAQTMITWGEEPKEVVAFLEKQGLASGEAIYHVVVLVEQRNRSIRRRGIRRIATGAVVAIGCSVTLVYLVTQSEISEFFDSRIPGEELGLMMIGTIWGLWGLIDGLRDVFRPKNVDDCLDYHHEAL